MRKEIAMQASRKSTQKLGSRASRPQYRPLTQHRPLTQEGKGNGKGKPGLKKARCTSTGAPLVSESDLEKS